MSRSGIGVGSASIVLVFAVLCLTVFSLITYVVASNEKNLVDVKLELVTGYYEADTLAEFILFDIRETTYAGKEIPDSIRGVDIHTGWDDELGLETKYFLCYISDIKALYVNLGINDDFIDILAWRMYDTDEWLFDDSINVWTGVED